MNQERRAIGSLTPAVDLRDKIAAGRPLLIGVVHLPALPGAPGYQRSGDPDPLREVLEAARRDAAALEQGGADGVIVENFGDAPFFGGAVPPHTVAAMARAIDAVHGAAPGLAVGANVLRNDARSALALCAVTHACFLRVNVHVGAMLTDQGLIEGRAAETMRERARLVPRALLLADVQVKHAQPLAPQAIEESALETLQRGGADLVVVSGTRTGGEPDLGELERVAASVGRERVLLGSGLTEHNAPELLAHARGAIVGTSIKCAGELSQPIDPDRVARLRALMDSLRSPS